MTAASITADHYAKAFAAVVHGDKAAPIFAAAGLHSLSDVLCLQPSFATAVPIDSELIHLHNRLAAAGKVGTVTWPASFDKTSRILRSLVSAMASIKPAEMAAVAHAAAAGATAATGTTAAALPVPAAGTAAVDKKRGAELYEVAQRVHAREYHGSEMVKHEVVGKLNAGFLLRAPTGYALSEYGLHLKVLGTRKETYQMLGDTFVRQDAADKPVAVSSWEDMLLQMERRAEAKAVAGCFDVVQAAKNASVPAPMGKHVWDGSEIRWVEDSAGALVARAWSCYATPAGQALQVNALRELHRSQPHLKVSQLVTIDARVERRISDLILKGYTGDAACFEACVKSPELYSAANITPAEEGEAEASTDAAPAGGEAAKGKNKRKGGTRSDEDEVASLKRQLDQSKRHAENLKNGKAGGKGGKGGKGGYQQWHAPPWQQQQYGNWQQQQQGGGGGPPGGQVKCPDNICRDYNFKVNGCERGNACQKDHKCPQCGRAHPYRGNH